MARVRLRGLGLTIGSVPTGKFNAITDVAGVKVGYFTLQGAGVRLTRFSD
jgi:D-aminopeptidase